MLKVKDKDNLYIVIYDKFKSDLSKKFIKQCRGIILEKNTNRVVCYTFDNNDDFDYNSELKMDINDTVIEESIDGTQIRLFFYDGKWNYATTRCIDAYRSYWKSERSFGSMFEDVKHLVDFEELNKDYCYSFVLKHIDNRIVVEHFVNDLILVCVRDMTTLKEVDKFVEGKRILVTLPKVYEEFKSLDDVVEYCKNDKKITEEGFMLYNKTNGKRVKIIKKSYSVVKKLLNNARSIEYNFFCLLKNGQLEEYLNYFPLDDIQIKLMKHRLGKMVQSIHYYYMRKNINRNILVKEIPFAYRPHVYKLHGIYKETRKPITYDVVKNYFMGLHEKQHFFIYNNIFNKKQD